MLGVGLGSAFGQGKTALRPPGKSGKATHQLQSTGDMRLRIFFCCCWKADQMSQRGGSSKYTKILVATDSNLIND